MMCTRMLKFSAVFLVAMAVLVAVLFLSKAPVKNELQPQRITGRNAPASVQIDPTLAAVRHGVQPPGTTAIKEADESQGSTASPSATGSAVQQIIDQRTAADPAPTVASIGGLVPFDSDAYAADPEGYLAQVQPNRIWQPAPRDGDAPMIVALSASYQRVQRDAPLEIEVRVPPQAPVTFHCDQAARFDNGVNTITVAADEQGLAQVKFRSASTTRHEIAATSPLAKGSLRFVVVVE
jgi:hypothetical protein